MLALSSPPVGGVLDPVIEFIQGKARAGAEQAIPEIEQRVKETATQIIAPVVVLAVGSFVISVIALREVRRSRKSLSGARRR